MWIEKMPGWGRAALLWGVGIFLLAQLSFTVAVERWHPEWRDPEYGSRFGNLKKRMKKEPDTPLLVVLGSSRVGNGFKADCLPPPTWNGSENPLVFNMAKSGGTPTCELLILKRLLAAGIRPRWLVIEVLPPVLNWEDRTLAAPEPIPSNRFHWSDLEVLDRYAPGTRWSRKQKWLEDSLLPWYSDRYVLLSRYASSWLEPGKAVAAPFQSMTSKGWSPFPFTSVTQEQYKKWFAVARDNFTEMLANFRISAEADHLFREMLEICRKERIEVLGLLLMPEGTDIRNLYSLDVCRAINVYLQGLCREFDIELIDARTWLSDDCFCDGHHMLPCGAEQFTLRLWRDALEPKLK
jgi:hypothetical protein